MQTRDSQIDRGLPDKLYRPAEAAALLGVTVKTLQRWAGAGKISAIRTVGGARRFPQSEVDRIRGASSAAVS